MPDELEPDDAIEGIIWPPGGPDPQQYQAYMERYGPLMAGLTIRGLTLSQCTVSLHNLYYAYGGTDDNQPTASEPSSDSPLELPSSDTSSS